MGFPKGSMCYKFPPHTNPTDCWIHFFHTVFALSVIPSSSPSAILEKLIKIFLNFLSASKIPDFLAPEGWNIPSQAGRAVTLVLCTETHGNKQNPFFCITFQLLPSFPAMFPNPFSRNIQSWKPRISPSPCRDWGL